MPNFKNIESVIASKPKDFKLVNYEPMDSIKAPMAV
jgi:thymidylate synthase